LPQVPLTPDQLLWSSWATPAPMKQTMSVAIAALAAFFVIADLAAATRLDAVRKMISARSLVGAGVPELQEQPSGIHSTTGVWTTKVGRSSK